MPHPFGHSTLLFQTNFENSSESLSMPFQASHCTMLAKTESIIVGGQLQVFVSPVKINKKYLKIIYLFTPIQFSWFHSNKPWSQKSSQPASLDTLFQPFVRFFWAQDASGIQVSAAICSFQTCKIDTIYSWCCCCCRNPSWAILQLRGALTTVWLIHDHKIDLSQSGHLYVGHISAAPDGQQTTMTQRRDTWLRWSTIIATLLEKDNNRRLARTKTINNFRTHKVVSATGV